MKGFDVQSHRFKRDNFEKLETVFSKEDSEDFGRESMVKHGHHAKDFYEMRLSELSKTVASTVAALTDDQLLSTMLEEPTSRPFAQHRVKEIIEECMENDREGLIKQLSEQLAALESDYCELEQEYSKVYQEQKDNIQELQEKIEDMQTQHNSDVKERESIMVRMDKVKQSTEELTEKYENRLKSKEKEQILKAERQQTEAKIMADKLNDLQKKKSEFEEELDIKRRELHANEKKLSEANELLLRYESSQKRQSEDIIKLNEENIRLREKLVQYEDGKKAFEEGFRQRIKDIEKGIENEKEMERQNRENLQSKFEEKMEKYKEKIMSYKSRLSEKENEFEVAIAKHKEIEFSLNKTILALENKSDDQKVKFEHTLSQVEFDNNKFTHEQREHYEKNLQNLEKRFEDVFNRKLQQLQNEAEMEIEHLKHEKDKLQRLLEENQFIMEREYIKIVSHEDAIQDKNNVIKRLEQDLLDQDYESNCRLRDLEQRFNSESNLKQLESQRLISGLEVQVSELKAQKNLLESEKLNLKKENHSVKEELQECTGYNARLIDTVEQWTSKAEKLDLACEEEIARGRELEQKIAEYKERNQELKKAYEAIVEESLEKDLQMRKLTEQISVLEKELKQRGIESKSLNIKSQNCEEEIFRLREQLEDSKKQERANDLRAFENEEKLKRIALEVEEAHRENSRLNSDGETLRKQKHDLKAKLSKVTEICKRITKDKQSTEKNLERAVIKINKMESSINKAIRAKVAIVKNELSEMREHQRVTTLRMTKENEAKVMELTKHFMGILVQAKEQQAQELQREFNYQYEGLKEKSLRMERDLEEMYEQKYSEKERNVKYVQDINNKLNENVKSLKEDAERLQLKYSRCLDEAEKTAREKANAELRLDQLRQQYVSEINSFNYELQKCSQEFMSQKIILQDERATEIKNLLAEVEKLRNVNQETLTKYQAHVQQLSTRYTDEIETLERSYKSEAQEVTKMLTESRLVEQELAIKMLDLNEKVYKIETKNHELEKENVILKQKEDEYLGLYESKIDELKTMITKDNERMNAFKTEKFKELSNYKSAIFTFEKEVSLKDKKIEDLSEEKELLKRRMQELVAQNNVLETQREKQKLNRTENTYMEGRENSKLRSKTLENCDGGLDTFLATASLSRRKYPNNGGVQGKHNSTALTLNNSRFSKKDVESSYVVSTRKSQYRSPLGTQIPTSHLTMDDFDS